MCFEVIYQFLDEDGSTILSEENLIVNLIIQNNITSSELVQCSSDIDEESGAISNACNFTNHQY